MMPMTVATGTVTRGEFDLLRQMVTTSNQRIESLDEHGTRGIGVLSASIAEVVKDVTTLTTDVNARFDGHKKQHDQDRRERISGRRWLIGTAIAGVASVAAIIALLIELLTRSH